MKPWCQWQCPCKSLERMYKRRLEHLLLFLGVGTGMISMVHVRFRGSCLLHYFVGSRLDASSPTLDRIIHHEESVPSTPISLNHNPFQSQCSPNHLYLFRKSDSKSLVDLFQSQREPGAPLEAIKNPAVSLLESSGAGSPLPGINVVHHLLCPLGR